MENSIEKDEEILNNIKTYMQVNIDKGYHKFIYNDLGYEEKCIDVINAIEHILSDYKIVLNENEELKETNEELSENKLLQDIEIKKKFIPVQKVKDKIEKLNDESHAEELEDIMNRKNYTITELVQYVLQELLEK